jgi:peptide/nickel transport system substrate-binding protein
MSASNKSSAPFDPAAEVMADPRFSRRDILRFAGMGAGALSVGALLDACGGSSSSPSSSGTTSIASGSSPASTSKGGWQKGPVSFVFLDTTEPDTLDPSLQTQFDSMLIIRNTYDTLTFTDESTNKLKPWVASKWTANKDVTQWKFTIKSGIHFSDGSPLNPAAVVLSFKRHLAIGAPAQGGYMLTGIKDVKQTGANEVTFYTSGPQPWLPYHMVMFPIISAKAIDDHKTSSDPWAKKWFQDNVAGSGAYTLDSWVKGTKITLAKNPKWWQGPWKAGSIDNVTIQWESSPGTTVELIEKGAANFATEWSIDNALSLAKTKGFTLKRFNAYNTDPMIAFNQTKAPFDKLDVRQAVQLAFNYTAMRDYFRNYAKPTVGVLPSFNPYVLKSLPEYTTDLTKAKAILSKAGISPSSITGTCYTAAGYPDLVAGGTVLQSSIASLGGNIKVQNVPFGTLETDVSKASTSPALTSALYNGAFSLDPTSFLSSFLPKSFGNEFMHYNSPALVKAYDQANSSTNAADIRHGLNSAQQIIHDDAPVIFGALPELIIPVPDYLDGYVMQTTGDQYPTLFYQLRLREH